MLNLRVLDLDGSLTGQSGRLPPGGSLGTSADVGAADSPCLHIRNLRSLQALA